MNTGYNFTTKVIIYSKKTIAVKKKMNLNLELTTK
nr:MAG TPA: hypothetical protein [Caudoviricetes sp.]